MQNLVLCIQGESVQSLVLLRVNRAEYGSVQGESVQCTYGSAYRVNHKSMVLHRVNHAEYGYVWPPCIQFHL